MLYNLQKTISKLLNESIRESVPGVRIKLKQRLIEKILKNKPPKSETRDVRPKLEKIRIEDCSELERKLDLNISENLFQYITRGEIRSHEPLAEDEILRRLMGSVHFIRPLKIRVIWGGNKETEYHKADYFDYGAIKNLFKLIPTTDKKAVYPFEITILFCDSHATKINNVDPSFVENYRDSLIELVQSPHIEKNDIKFEIINISEIGSELDRYHKISKKLSRYGGAYGIGFSGLKKDEELIKLLGFNPTQPSTKKGIFKEFGPYLRPLSKLYKYEEKINKHPQIKLLQEFIEIGHLKAYKIVNDPNLFKLFERQVGLHSRDKNAAIILNKYIATRFVESTLFFNWYEDSIFVSCGGRPDRESFFSNLPTIYMKCVKDYSDCPWFMDITNSRYILKLKSSEKEEAKRLDFL